MGWLASVPSGAAVLRWWRNWPFCPAVPKKSKHAYDESDKGHASDSRG